jgi:predicted GNAT family acetyltransferase
MSQHVLDNPAWHALTGPHAVHAQGSGLARRYDPDVSIFHAMADESEQAWRDVAEIASRAGYVALAAADTPSPPSGWEVVFSMPGRQMWLTERIAVATLPPTDGETGSSVSLRPLTQDDVPELSALVALTEPGPWRPRTFELGGYVGIFHDETLVAAAGQRIHPPGHCEVSAVCTHPDARRRGYASILTAHVAGAIADRGETPFLHVVETNTSAIAVYERLGFTTRTIVRFCALRIPGATDEESADEA